jgi:uncharacterized protein HemY
LERLAEDFPDTPRHVQDLARFLATCPDSRFQEPDRAAVLAARAVEQAPEAGDCWSTLGVAQYRAGDWKAATAALGKSIQLRTGGDPSDWFFLAMAHGRLGEKDQGRKWYDKAIAWMEQIKSQNNELRCFRAEAAVLLGVADSPLPQTWEVRRSKNASSRD